MYAFANIPVSIVTDLLEKMEASIFHRLGYIFHSFFTSKFLEDFSVFLCLRSQS